MEENIQQSKFIIIMKKIWPTVYRWINASFYFILNLIRNIIKGIIEQVKGSM